MSAAAKANHERLPRKQQGPQQRLQDERDGTG